jgi:hypothetical protein
LPKNFSCSLDKCDGTYGFVIFFRQPTGLFLVHPRGFLSFLLKALY